MASKGYTTFRLRGIPETRDKGHVENLLRQALRPVDGDIRIHSLARDPFNHRESIATLSFSEVPALLASASGKTEWPLETELFLDTHFHGMTPLHCANDDACTVE